MTWVAKVTVQIRPFSSNRRWPGASSPIVVQPSGDGSVVSSANALPNRRPQTATRNRAVLSHPAS